MEDLGSNVLPGVPSGMVLELVSVYVAIKESDINTMHLYTREKQLIVE